MAAFDYAAAADDARALLRDFGALRTVTKVAHGEFDAEAGEYTGDANTTFQLLGAVVPVNSSVSFERSSLKTETVIKIEKMVLMEASAVGTPNLGDFIDLDGTEFCIFGITTLAPAGVPVLHKVHALVT